MLNGIRLDLHFIDGNSEHCGAFYQSLFVTMFNGTGGEMRKMQMQSDTSKDISH